MVYLYYILCLRYTIVVGNPRIIKPIIQLAFGQLKLRFDVEDERGG